MSNNPFNGWGPTWVPASGHPDVTSHSTWRDSLNSGKGNPKIQVLSPMVTYSLVANDACPHFHSISLGVDFAPYSSQLWFELRRAIELYKCGWSPQICQITWHVKDKLSSKAFLVKKELCHFALTGEHMTFRLIAAEQTCTWPLTLALEVVLAVHRMPRLQVFKNFLWLLRHPFFPP